jgi:hypothetical protein
MRSPREISERISDICSSVGARCTRAFARFRFDQDLGEAADQLGDPMRFHDSLSDCLTQTRSSKRAPVVFVPAVATGGSRADGDFDLR